MSCFVVRFYQAVYCVCFLFNKKIIIDPTKICTCTIDSMHKIAQNFVDLMSKRLLKIAPKKYHSLFERDY